MKYRKKPVEIEAMRVPAGDDLIGWGEIFAWLALGGQECEVAEDTFGLVAGIDIPTLEGTMRADIGDWIIKGIQGEFYPCKPSIFAATYDKVDEQREQLEGQLTIADI